MVTICICFEHFQLTFKKIERELITHTCRSSIRKRGILRIFTELLYELYYIYMENQQLMSESSVN